MKVCPACRTTFDDSQNFCLNDGTPLVAAETEPEPATIVTPAAAPPKSNVEYRSYQTPPATASVPAVGKKSNTGLIVAGTALATLLLLGLGAGGWWIMSRSGNNNREIARTNVNASTISNSNLNSAPRASPSASVTNSSVAANSNAMPTNSTIAAPETNPEIPQNAPAPPAHEISAKEAATVRKEVGGTINSWANAIESGNLNGHLGYYADTLDYYYNARGFSKNQVRADKERAFETFDNIEFNISNIRVTPEAGGDRATVVYDKEWLFENDERSTEGKVQSQLTLQKIGGRWLIVGERDLKVYYQESR